MAQQMTLPFSFGLETDFARFHSGESNRQLVSALKDTVASDSGENVVFWSSDSAGKSHLLQACCHLADTLGKRAAYLPLKMLAQASPAAIEDLAACDLITLDDIHLVAGIPHWEEAIFHAYNQIRQEGSTFIVSSAEAPAAFSLVMPDLVSRLKSAEIYQIVALTDDEKCDALMDRASARGIQLNSEVCQYCLSRVGRDWISLMTVLNAIDQFSIQEKRRVTIPLVKLVLEHISS